MDKIYRGTVMNMQGDVICVHTSNNYLSLLHVLRHIAMDMITYRIHKDVRYKWIIMAYGMHYRHGYVTYNDTLEDK